MNEHKELLERLAYANEGDSDIAEDASVAIRELVDRRGEYEAELANVFDKLADTQASLAAAEKDIAALLWLNGNCEYCAHGKKEEYFGATRWNCGLSGENGFHCLPKWRGRRD